MPFLHRVVVTFAGFMRCSTTFAVMPKRAATSSMLCPTWMSALNASNWSARCVACRISFSLRSQ